ncbi:peptide ligase PGM1-related protein [Streptomyces sp. B93]|uniref:preATP grasp domain-containing protein n=1 Tax=Streptomyces sp. B93 TaxID=2824875 RepID=UPI001FFD3D4F|nr:peptide ligase PGM1-related protein [Streptomyces sp. B93]
MDLLTEGDYRGILFAMKRLTWLLKDHDILIIPRPVTQDFLEYVTRHTGTDPATLRVISPNAPLLTYQELRTSKVSAALQEPTTEPLTYRPYIHDRGAVTFAQHIGVDDDNASSSFLAEGGAELLNSKVAFRALAASAGLPIPGGMACRTTGDLIHAVKRLLSRTGSVIMKRDRAVGGHGNVVITTNEDVHAVGAMQTLRVTDTSDLTALVTASGLAQTYAPMGEVVVEEFLPDCRSVYAEVHCPPLPEEPHIVNTGSLRTGEDPPVLAGLELPLADVSDDVWKGFADGTLRLARLMQTLGYQGLASIDAIISPDGTVRFNEVNARLGGSTHLDAIATVLLGTNWADDHVLLSRFSVPAPPFATLVEDLAHNGLAWDSAVREGVVIASDDTEASGTVEYVVLAPTWSRCRALEAELHAYLAESMQLAEH